MDTNKNRLCKIIYFDEDSVTDYIQIVMGGKLEKTSELLNQSNDEGNADLKSKVSIGLGGTLKALLGIEASSSVEASVQTSFSTQEMAKNIIKNTILTDFIDILEDNSSVNSNKKGTICQFRDYKVSVHKESLTYVALISPYLSMLKGDSAIPAGEFNIAINKLENTMKSAKGYYEFIGKKDQKNVIFRFNIKSFKNNYKVTDLLKMDISIYAIKVGTTTIDKLNLNSELDLDPTLDIRDNPTYSNVNESVVDTLINTSEILDVYDALLAGVESSD